MSVDRRNLLVGAAAIGALSALPGARAARAAVGGVEFSPKPGDWRSFEVLTSLDLTGHGGPVQVWVPVPGFAADDWMRPGETAWSANDAAVEIATDERSGASMLHVSWDASAVGKVIDIRTSFSGRDRAVDLGAGTSTGTISQSERDHYTAPTKLLPLDGIVAETSAAITAGHTTDLDKAGAIYQWVVENTFRNPETRGCGLGDIASMLLTGDLSGKCADLNSLYVGLARAAGLPARDVYGIRVAPSRFGYKSLGANSPTITKAQHCRAEVFIEGIGWVPVDPADVRKVALEEPPGNHPLAAPMVSAARAALFGSWETNWLAYNDAHDVVLPGSDGPTLPFLMYPEAETADGRLDPLDPDAFAYTITAREITT